MNPIRKIWNNMRKGGAKLGMVQNLNVITDHEAVNIDEREYRRIVQAMKWYRGEFPNDKFYNYKNEECERPYYDLPMSVIISEYLANLIVNESFELNVTEGSEGEEAISNDYINSIFEENAFKKKFGQYLSPMFGVGGLAVRPYFNGETIEFAWALADAFFPLRNNTNKISEGVFITSTKRDKKYYTLLEFHRWKKRTVDNKDGSKTFAKDYHVDNELYESDSPSKIGVQVSLKTLYDDLEANTVFTGLSRPLFAYLKPSSFNNINPYSPLGLGVVDNAKSLLEQVNMTNNQMQHDMEKASPKIIGSEHFFKTIINENGDFVKMIPDNSDHFMLVGGDQATLQDMTPTFDPEGYINKQNYHFLMLEKKMKLQQGTFSMDKERGVKTATQVVSEDSDTFRTRNMEISQIESFLAELVISTAELATALGLYTGKIPEYKDITVDFDDGIFTSKQQELDFYGAGLDKGIIPKVEAIKRIYKLNDAEAEDWLAKINDEIKTANPDYMDIMNEVSMNGKLE